MTTGLNWTSLAYVRDNILALELRVLVSAQDIDNLKRVDADNNS